MFSEIFSKCTQSKGISLYKLSKDTKIPKTIVYDWAAGAREPVSEYLIILADYLNVSIDYLLGRTDNPEVNK
ncbi:MAG: helix-turn-helix domain-containing protein [Oscillospiraceae bacterium]|nr:helix-turn-helix domain-containing protein [Oscillospiraceae bacterium]